MGQRVMKKEGEAEGRDAEAGGAEAGGAEDDGERGWWEKRAVGMDAVEQRG